MSTVLLAALGCALLVEIAVFVLAVTGNAEWFYTSQVYLPLSTSVTVLLILGGWAAAAQHRKQSNRAHEQGRKM
ncbi:MAG TPA: hypothetical protein VNJ54_20630 [Plantibacter sp.]|uniref:hypothetical protein n=1 Tax=Plantibacter sp. TaxID=1871045 RepID=UPI002BE0A3D6|nr:hypothetical protein [Plantibacter sp.]